VKKSHIHLPESLRLCPHCCSLPLPVYLLIYLYLSFNRTLSSFLHSNLLWAPFRIIAPPVTRQPNMPLSTQLLFFRHKQRRMFLLYFSLSFSYFWLGRRTRYPLSANTTYVVSSLCMSYSYCNRQRRPPPFWKILCWGEYTFFLANDSEASSPRLVVSLPHIIRRPARSFILVIILSQNTVDRARQDD